MHAHLQTQGRADSSQEDACDILEAIEGAGRDVFVGFTALVQRVCSGNVHGVRSVGCNFPRSNQRIQFQLMWLCFRLQQPERLLLSASTRQPVPRVRASHSSTGVRTSGAVAPPGGGRRRSSLFLQEAASDPTHKQSQVRLY